MPLPLYCRVSAQPDGGWRILMGDGQTRPAEALLPRAGARAIAGQVHERLGTSGRVFVRGHDASRVRAEEEIGQALSAVLTASPDLLRRLSEHLGRARGRRELAVLVFDVEDPALRELPWELIAADPSSPPMECYGDIVVARLGAARSLPEPLSSDSTLQVLCWCPGGDAASLRLVTELERRLAGLGLAEPVSLTLESETIQRPDAAQILHIICHGRADLESISLQIGADRQASGTLSHALASRLPKVALVVLDVCRGGGATKRELDSLVSRLIATGARAVIAPTVDVSTDAAAAFARGLYTALSSGADTVHAVAAGRAAVRALAHPHPDSRWFNHALFVGTIEELARSQPASPAWRPEGWPAPSADAAGLLSDAARIAGEDQVGFVGLEHLALALEKVAPTGAVARRARLVLRPARESIERALAWLEAPANPRARSTPPRLLSLGEQLRDGFDLEALWQLICQAPDHALHLWTRDDLQACLPAASQSASTVDWTSQSPDREASGTRCDLQVIGGPEDGRVLPALSGAIVGRWDASAAPLQQPLYRGGAAWDPTLSRRHLQWMEGSAIRALRGCLLLRQRQERSVSSGEVLALQPGDVLVVGRTTRLRAVASRGL